MNSLIRDANGPVIHTLRDGSTVRLGFIGPADRDRLAAGFLKMSPESRYLRFFSAMPRLPEDVLQRLTDTDGHNHVAIGASLASDGAALGEGLGVARFIRLPDAPDTAEAAVAVIDEKQGLGLGTLLMRALVEVAREHGIRHFRASILHENTGAIALLESMHGRFRVRPDGELLIYEIDLPGAADHESAWDPFYRLLKLAAEGVELIFRRLTEHA
jgi:GNAT superfamily N-acetyltransferase